MIQGNCKGYKYIKQLQEEYRGDLQIIQRKWNEISLTNKINGPFNNTLPLGHASQLHQIGQIDPFVQDPWMFPLFQHPLVQQSSFSSLICPTLSQFGPRRLRREDPQLGGTARTSRNDCGLSTRWLIEK